MPVASGAVSHRRRTRRLGHGATSNGVVGDACGHARHAGMPVCVPPPEPLSLARLGTRPRAEEVPLGLLHRGRPFFSGLMKSWTPVLPVRWCYLLAPKMFHLCVPSAVPVPVIDPSAPSPPKRSAHSSASFPLVPRSHQFDHPDILMWARERHVSALPRGLVDHAGQVSAIVYV